MLCHIYGGRSRVFVFATSFNGGAMLLERGREIGEAEGVAAYLSPHALPRDSICLDSIFLITYS